MNTETTTGRQRLPGLIADCRELAAQLRADADELEDVAERWERIVAEPVTIGRR